MADNVASNAGSGGANWAADDISSVYYARGKIVIGADGVNDGDVSASNPLPVKGTGTAGTANSGVVTIQGIASMTAVQVSDGGGSLTVDGTVAATQSGTWDVGTVTTVTNVVHVDDNAGSLTVDGTVAATQSGTWNVTNVSGTVSLPTGASTAAKQPALGTAGTASADVLSVQGIASMTPILVDGSGVTQPVSAASLPLPSGASTAAKQPALGTAGTASADVITIQGITSMTPILVNGSGVTQPISASSLPLPTGASTAAKQPALGTAGTASSDVISIQGIASMTPLQIADNGSTLSIDDGGGAITVDGTVAVSGTVTTSTRSGNTDGIVAYIATDSMGNGIGDLKLVNRARATATASGNTQVIAAVTSTKLRVLSWSASSDSTVNIHFRTGASTAISATRYLVQYGGAGRSFNPLGVMETASGEALNINLSGTGTVSVEVEYLEI